MRCPTCGARTPNEHPATGYEGEVYKICEDPFHGDTTELRKRLGFDRVDAECAADELEQHILSPLITNGVHPTHLACSCGEQFKLEVAE